MNFETINHYINTNFSKTNVYKECILSLTKISEFLNQFFVTNEILVELILNNEILNHLLKTVVYNNIQLIKTGKIQTEINNRTSILLIETYCMIYNIHIQDDENIVRPKTKKSEEVNIVSQYLKEIGSWPLLTEEEEKELALKVKNNDPEAKKEFIERNLRLVIGVAKKHLNRGVSFLDLIQEGNIGLMNAVEKYDISKGYKFSTYAIYWIRFSITRFIANNGRNIRIPAHLYTEVGTYIKTKDRLEKILNREATLEEIANAMRISLSHASKLNGFLVDTISMNTYVNDEENTELGDFIPATQYETETIALENTMKSEVFELLQNCNLSQREIEIITLRFGLGTGEIKTFEEISKNYGITRERIRQLEEKALTKMRNSTHIKEFACYMDNPLKAKQAIDQYRLKFRNNGMKNN